MNTKNQIQTQTPQTQNQQPIQVQLVAKRAYELMREYNALAFASYDLPGETPDGHEIDYAKIVKTELDRALYRYARLKIVDVCGRCVDESIYLVAPSDLPDADVEAFFRFLLKTLNYREVVDCWTRYVERYLGRPLEEILQDIKEAWGLVQDP